MEKSRLPFENMAHRVDMSEDFKQSFIKQIAKLEGSKTRTQRINNLALIFLNLNKYMSSLGIDKDTVDEKRTIKAHNNGVLDEGWIRESPEQKKLVRDKIHNLPKRIRDSDDTFYRIDRAGHLRELEKKLTEDAAELLFDANSKEKRTEELGDIFEVLYTIIKFRDIRVDEVLTRTQSLETKDRIKQNQARRKLLKNKLR